MPYVDATTFGYFYPNRTVSATGDVTASQFNQMVEEFSSEINRFHSVTTDICSVSDVTQESYLHAKIVADLIEEKINYINMQRHVRPDLRTERPPPSLWDINHSSRREALRLERAEEKARAMNYNLRTGRIRRWY